jgi:hypothetical protein
MSDSILDLLSKLKVENTQKQQHYVYYNSDTMAITKISPVKKDSEYKVFAIDSERVESILLGTSKLDDYIVFFDYNTKDYNIKKKKSQNIDTIPLIEVGEKLSNFDLEVVLTLTNIAFVVNRDLIEHIKDDTGTMMFVFTEQNNPYKMYSNIEIQTKDLLDNNAYEHHLTPQQIENGVSIYTNKIFEKYSLEVTND